MRVEIVHDPIEAIHLWELACRWDLFPPVARHRMPYIGNSDFHDRPHLYAWKTLLPCERNVADVVRTLKRGKGLAVTRLEPSAELEVVPGFAIAAVTA